MPIIDTKDYFQHVGVLGMHWGVRKSETNSSGNSKNYETDSLVIKRGSELHRLSTVSKETNKGSGYASFLKEDSETYKSMGKIFSKCGAQQFDMTLKAKKDLVSPSQKERVDVFIKKMSDPAFAKELRSQQARMFILNMVTPQDIRLSRRYKNLPLNKARAYRMLNSAISGNKSLRKQYLDEFKKAHYDFIIDEGDLVNKQAKAPIIFLEREHSLVTINVEKL